MTSHDTKESIIGIIGGAASGKDTVANAFRAHGYVHVSASDLVREEIAQRSLTTSRALQTKIANEMREANGEGFWVSQALSRVATGTGRVVISGLYAPGEGGYVTDVLGGTLVGIRSTVTPEDDAQVRFERLQNRGDGQRDQIAFGEFEAAEFRENGGTEGFEANIAALLEMAQFTIYNTGDLNYLDSQVYQIAQQIEAQR